jgi:carbon-monoxide dehydrogenase iron sulfur subunit
MKRVYVNEEWCLGCHLCEYYCAFAASDEPDMARALKGHALHPRIQVEEAGAVHFAVSCRHCEEPWCVKACLTGALTKADGGMVSVDKTRCVGCFTCVACCPYGAIAPSPDGAVQKCELCVGKGAPKCVQGCPNGAIVFEEREVI